MTQRSAIATLTPVLGLALNALASAQQTPNRPITPASGKQEPLNGPYVAELAREITFPLADAISAAERYCGGRAVRADCTLTQPPVRASDASIETPPARSRRTCVVSLLVGDGELVEAIVNAQTGQVLSKRELTELPAALASTPAVVPQTHAAANLDYAMPRRWQTATDLVGKPVINNDGETLGKIEDMVADVNSGRVAYGVHSFGNLPDMGGRLYPVPWQAGQLSNDNTAFALNVKRDRLHSAPGFGKTQWPDFTDPRFAASTFRHYNQNPYWEGEASSAPVATNDAAAQTRTQSPSPRPGDARPAEAGANADSRSPTPVRQVAPTAAYVDPWSQRQSAFQRISELRGREIRTPDGSSLGKIGDVVLDPESGRILYAINTFRGKLQPIPWAALRAGPDGNYFSLDIDPERLKSAPTFDRERWPNVVDPQWAQDVHAFYNVDPFWRTAPTDPGR